MRFVIVNSAAKALRWRLHYVKPPVSFISAPKNTLIAHTSHTRRIKISIGRYYYGERAICLSDARGGG